MNLAIFEKYYVDSYYNSSISQANFNVRIDSAKQFSFGLELAKACSVPIVETTYNNLEGK